MFFNVVGAYIYKNYTIHSFNQCLPVPRHTNITFFFLIKRSLVNMAHTPCDVKLLNGFRCSMQMTCDWAFVKKKNFIHLATCKSICKIMHASSRWWHALHTNAPIGSVLESYRSIAAMTEIERSKRASDVTSIRLSSVTWAIDNDVCVRRFVKFARQKSFSG